MYDQRHPKLFIKGTHESDPHAELISAEEARQIAESMGKDLFYLATHGKIRFSLEHCVYSIDRPILITDEEQTREIPQEEIGEIRKIGNIWLIVGYYGLYWSKPQAEIARDAAQSQDHAAPLMLILHTEDPQERYTIELEAADRELIEDETNFLASAANETVFTMEIRTREDYDEEIAARQDEIDEGEIAKELPIITGATQEDPAIISAWRTRDGNDSPETPLYYYVSIRTKAMIGSYTLTPAQWEELKRREIGNASIIREEGQPVTNANAHIAPQPRNVTTSATLKVKIRIPSVIHPYDRQKIIEEIEALNREIDDLIKNSLSPIAQDMIAVMAYPAEIKHLTEEL